jgi:kynurenine formamidase
VDEGLLERIAAARVYDLARPLQAGIPTIPHHAAFRMGMIRRHGDVRRADGGSGANELITLGGHTGTHVDALCHMSHEGRLHGGLPIEGALTSDGCFAALGVDEVPPALCRGVLLDVPRALGMEALPAARAITAEDLETACRAADVDIRPGDAVLVRTGWPVGRFDDPAAYLGWETGVPGPDASAATWLAGRGVRITGADTIAYEWLPEGRGHERLPVHRILLVDHGIPMIEVLDLEDLAADGVTRFLFVAAPLRIVGATGSPLRPLALV